MRKKIMVMLVLLSICQMVQAETISTSSRFNTFYNYEGGAIRVHVNFVKMNFPKEYGILARANFVGMDGDRRRTLSETAFFRPTNGKLVCADKELFFVNNEGIKFLVATKKFLGWKAVSNVDLQHEIYESFGKFSIKAWADIN